jgi:hypothetical protein
VEIFAVLAKTAVDVVLGAIGGTLGAAIAGK